MRLPGTFVGAMSVVTLALIVLAIVSKMMGSGMWGVLAGAAVLLGGGALVADLEERYKPAPAPKTPEPAPAPATGETAKGGKVSRRQERKAARQARTKQ